MKTFSRVVLSFGVLLAVSLTALPQRRSVPPVRLEGTYDNLHVGPPESGDLEGMRVMLIDGGGGIYAIVQEAAGGVELPEPVLAQVIVRGSDISFTFKVPGQDDAQTFSGKVSASGLTLHRSRLGEPASVKPISKGVFFLKRRKC